MFLLSLVIFQEAIMLCYAMRHLLDKQGEGCSAFTAAQDVRREDFPLATLGPKLRGLLDEVRVGRGFQFIR